MKLNTPILFFTLAFVAPSSAPQAPLIVAAAHAAVPAAAALYLASRYLRWPARLEPAAVPRAPGFRLESERRRVALQPVAWLSDRFTGGGRGLAPFAWYAAAAQIFLLSAEPGTLAAWSSAAVLYAWSVAIARGLEPGPARVAFAAAAALIPLPLWFS
ncbi:MAG TPA: hypothetical protein VFV50_06040 [Bdellovibrionales bacterium]|nr:hypothetical protein [Bdellovibrionales bacterium]